MAIVQEMSRKPSRRLELKCQGVVVILGALALAPLTYFVCSFVIPPILKEPLFFPWFGWFLVVVGMGNLIGGVVFVGRAVRPRGWIDGRWGLERDRDAQGDPETADAFAERLQRLIVLGGACLEAPSIFAFLAYLFAYPPLTTRLLVFVPTVLIAAILPLVFKARRTAFAIEQLETREQDEKKG